MQLAPDASLFELQASIFSVTSIPPEEQQSTRSGIGIGMNDEEDAITDLTCTAHQYGQAIHRACWTRLQTRMQQSLPWA